MDKKYDFFAFISYNSDDLKEAWRLKKKLDSYNLPTVLRKKYNKKRKPTREAFLDKINIQIGDLTDELREKLDSSNYLIVLCSPRSAQSNYVKAEIEYFTRNGREKEMLLFIIESDPANIEACFNPAIKIAEKRWSERDGINHEILATNIKEKYVDQISFLYRWPIIGSWLQRERAYMQLISTLLDLKFAQLWSCQKIRILEKLICWLIGIFLVFCSLFYTWKINQPIDVKANLNESSVHNSQLPPLKDAIVTIVFDNKTEKDTIHSMDKEALFTNIPHKFLNKQVRVLFSCRDFLDVDTAVVLSRKISLNISRDSTVYGNVHFLLWNPVLEQAVGNVEVDIEGNHVVSDEKGNVSLCVPLEQQRRKYHVISEIPLAIDTIYMPCGKNDCIFVKE